MIYKEAPGEGEDALGRSVSVCEEAWEDLLLPEVGGVEVGLPDVFCPRRSRLRVVFLELTPRRMDFLPV